MKIITANNNQDLELPLQLNISFNKVYDMLKDYANNENHPFNISAKLMQKEVENYPELINGFSDLSLLDKHAELIEVMLEGLFPEILTYNEIKAATLPFSFTSFKLTKRFEKILENSGQEFEFNVRNLEDGLMYIHACTLILAAVYDAPIDLKRPFYFDIPDVKEGVVKHYRMAFNGDFLEVHRTKTAPKITKDDIKVLLDNFDNIDIWKEKFPPNSYILKGFGIMNLFDVTADETISAIRNDLLRSDENLNDDLQKHLGQFFGIKDIKVGYSVYDVHTKNMQSPKVKKSNSLLLDERETICCSNEGFFCDGIINKIFNQIEPIAISDIEKYGENSNYNFFYNKLKEQNIGSIILIPIKADEESSEVAVLEIASPRPYELNSLNQNKLKDLVPVFKSAIKRGTQEYTNVLDATIQEHYTSLHPTVKWRFYEAAENYQFALQEKNENIRIEDIVFENVCPLYGQVDVKGSSMARNIAIKEDLITQLTLAIEVLEQACKEEKMPIYDELKFRVGKYLSSVTNGLNAGDEIEILSFLKREIYPVFNHIKQVNRKLAKHVETYMNRLDKNLQVVYERRKDYEDSVTVLNDRLANFIDKKQDEAQLMFPHYFERYKTDGVEYNMYIGQSLTKEKTYNHVYLHNLRLWQLQVMTQMENVAFKTEQELPHKLEVASLILVHSNPLAIRFRMDEKQFDVDGAYNIRYEILKKRIDKAHIKNTDERLTVPGKIAIVYSQDKDKIEYLKYISYLQSKGRLGNYEVVEIEDVQGASGLKAIRVDVVYNEANAKKTISIDELLQEFKA